MKRKPDPIVTYGYNHLEPGEPGNLKSYRVCGARTRSEDARSDLCQLKAGAKTDHPGVGRCYLHGGRSKAGPLAVGRWKGGARADVWRERMKQYLAAVDQTGEAEVGLMRELQVLRILLAGLMLPLIAADAGAADPDAAGVDPGAAALPAEVADDPIKVDARPIPPKANGVDRVGIASDYGYKGSPAHDVVGEFLLDPEMEERVRGLVNDINKVVTSIITLRNQTALTATDLKYLSMVLEELLMKFVPESKRKAAYEYLRERLGKSVQSGT